MDTQPTLRKAVSAAYAEPQVSKPIRRKPTPVPGWLFDAVVVFLLAVSVAMYFAA